MFFPLVSWKVTTRGLACVSLDTPTGFFFRGRPVYDKAQYIREHLAELPDDSVELFTIFCTVLRFRGINYLRYRRARLHYLLEQQMKLPFTERPFRDWEEDSL
jgi:hypothetical protein